MDNTNTIKSKDQRNLAVRIIVYFIGLSIIAVAVALSVSTELGVSAGTSYTFVLSLILDTKMGYCVIAVSVLHLVIQLIMLGKEFPLRNLLQIIPAVTFGYLIDFTRDILGEITYSSYMWRLCAIILSCALAGIGVSLYISAHLIPMTADGLCLVIAEKYKFKYHNVKNVSDIAKVALAVIMSFVFLHKLAGVREGTIILALLTGRFVKYANIIFSPIFKKLHLQ